MSKLICQTTLYLKQRINWTKPHSSMVVCRNICTSNILNAEPPKKKRRLDPAVLKTRVERKIKKHEREIARLESEPRQPIPILEYQLNNSEIRDLKSRPGRSLEDAGIDLATFKAARRLWTFYRCEQSRIEWRSIQKIEKAQTHALETLKELDEDLYKRTVAIDDYTLIPHISSHIRKETPANPKYTPPDGYIKNVTKEWVM